MKLRLASSVCASITLLMFFSCKKQNGETLFRMVPADESGIHFNNLITESDSINILTLEYIYNGGSVSVADFNNDGLPDIFFTGNMVPNRLYLNRGHLKFEDVTDVAGIGAQNKWRLGAALADVNQDGWMDIYVCASIKKNPEDRTNILFINQGLNADGIPTFKDEAHSYGIDDNGHSTYAAFLDYDVDGDLDLYVLTNILSGEIPSSYREKIVDGSALNNDRLYRNNGNGTFTNVTQEAGIRFEGYGLGLAIADINQDGFPDIYVSNDYQSNDVLYLNNKNGTFTNVIDQYIKHQAKFSMGNDIADINNDALPDIINLDMLPEGNLRRKTVIGGIGYITYINNEKFGYQAQYVRNMLQLNNGNNTFSEIGQLAGVHQTEWSWSPLIADYDNDGTRDLLITNGFPRDITDKDFGNYRSGPVGGVATNEYLLDSVPVVKISNYAFRNNGDLTFKDVTSSWGMTTPSFSNGAAFADLDLDGDLDYIVNNINDPVFLYENTLNNSEEEGQRNHYLRIQLEGPAGNLNGLGVKIRLHYSNGQSQYHDHSVYRGYLSTVEGIIHFGLGPVANVDSLLIYWPDGKEQLLSGVNSDQVLKVRYANAVPRTSVRVSSPHTFLTAVHHQAGLDFRHKESDMIDFDIQRTLPHKFSQYGPGLAVGDINGDQLEDLYISGAAKEPGVFFMQGNNGQFKIAGNAVNYSTEKTQEELGALLFDADGDGDNDLYCVSGSYEWPKTSDNYLHHLYVNDGRGHFSEKKDALPQIRTSGSCVRGADFDKDGDIDLFIGGRVIPGEFPYTPDSYLLRNDHGSFADVTEEVAPGLKKAGMIADALWTDFDNDHETDLILAGEYMPLTFWKGDGKKLTNVTSEAGIKDLKGWWNSLAAGDFDKDGDMDYVAGNLGRNNLYRASSDHPVRVFAKDFDGNGSVDPIVTCYFKMEDGTMQPSPVHFWDELSAQSPRFRRQFSFYKQYGRANIEKILLPKDMEGAQVFEGNYPSSSYFENLGNGTFRVTALPTPAQFAPVFGMTTTDLDNDGNLDLLLVGNDYGNELFTGRMDALIGLALKGDGKGNFNPLRALESGFVVQGDGKALVRALTRDGEVFVASQNRDSLRAFVSVSKGACIYVPVTQADSYAELTYSDGKKEKVEFFYGSGFLSQSSRVLRVPQGAKAVVYDVLGKKREIKTGN